MGGRGATLQKLDHRCTKPDFVSPIPFLFIFLRTLLRFFAVRKKLACLFSWHSALFDKNTRGWGTPLSLGNVTSSRSSRSQHERCFGIYPLLFSLSSTSFVTPSGIL